MLPKISFYGFWCSVKVLVITERGASFPGIPGVVLWDRKVKELVPLLSCSPKIKYDKLLSTSSHGKDPCDAGITDSLFLFFFLTVSMTGDRMLISICIINEWCFKLTRSLVKFSLHRYASAGGKIAYDCQV